MTWRRVAALALTALLAGGCWRGERRFEAEPVPETTTTASTTTSAPPPADLGPELQPDEVRGLPEEGIAVGIWDGEGGRVVLVKLDGGVVGHVEGSLRGHRESPGPLLLHDAERNLYLIDPERRRFAREPRGHLERNRMALGASLVSDFERDPGQSWVEREGKVLMRLGNGMDGSSTVANDRDIVTSTILTEDQPGRVESHRALDLRTGRIRPLPHHCDVGDRHGDTWYLFCRSESGGAIEALQATTRIKLLEPIHPERWWNAVAVSPDGKRLLAEWEMPTERCFHTTVRLATSDGADLTAPWGDAMTGARGWTRDGRAVVLVHPESSCAPLAPDPGVYLVAPDGTRTLVYRLVPGASTRVDAAVWAPLLR